MNGCSYAINSVHCVIITGVQMVMYSASSALVQWLLVPTLHKVNVAWNVTAATMKGKHTVMAKTSLIHLNGVNNVNAKMEKFDAHL